VVAVVCSLAGQVFLMLVIAPTLVILASVRHCEERCDVAIQPPGLITPILVILLVASLSALRFMNMILVIPEFGCLILFVL